MHSENTKLISFDAISFDRWKSIIPTAKRGRYITIEYSKDTNNRIQEDSFSLIMMILLYSVIVSNNDYVYHL